MSLKEQLHAAAKKRFAKEPADLPPDFEGRDGLFIRKLSGKERDEYEGSRIQVIDDGKGRTHTSLNYVNLRARLLVKTLCDPEGQRVFTNDDVAEVGEWPGDLLDTLFEQSMRFNKLKGAEDLAKKLSESDRWAYRFALALGRADIAELMDELTAEEVDGWRAFYAVEPWGRGVEDVYFSLLLSFIAAGHGQQVDPGNVFGWQRQTFQPVDWNLRRQQWLGGASVVIDKDGIITRNQRNPARVGTKA